MKSARKALLVAAAFVALALIGVAVALNSKVQTWVVFRLLARHPEWRLSIGRIDAGFRGFTAMDVRIERNGWRLAAPAVNAQLPMLSALLSKRVDISHFAASNWTLEAVAVSPVRSTAPAPTASPVATTSDEKPSSNALPGFPGVLAGLQLPFDLTLDGADLEGKVVARGHAVSVKVKGGGLRAGSTGKFDVVADSILGGEKVRALGLEGSVAATMDTPRTVTRVAADFTATAVGPSLSQPVSLRTKIAVSRGEKTESYIATLVSGDRTLADVTAEYPAQPDRIAGQWTLNLHDADFAPFLFGRAIPVFHAQGQGKFDADIALARVETAGELDASVDQLGAIQPDLAAIGAVKLAAKVDLAQRGDVLAVKTCEITLAADGPVAALHVLQPFEFNWKAGDLRATDEGHDVFDVALDGVPLAWAKPFLRDFVVTGDDLRGELVASPRAGGFTFRAKSPLVVKNLAVARAGLPLVEHVDVSLTTSGDYTPRGWQAELTGLTGKTGAATVLLLDAKAGRLAGADQPIKATGLLTLDLAALAAQPLARGSLPLSAGDATVDFVASLGPKHELQANVAVKRLAVRGQPPTETLPAISANLRADLAADGRITFNVPLIVRRDQRESDVTIVGEFVPAKVDGPVDARLTSNNLILDDAKALASVFASTASPDQKPTDTAVVPAWAILKGTVGLQLKKLVYSGTFQMSDVTGVLRFDGGKISFEKLRAAVGDDGDAKISGAMLFERGAPNPYRLGADLALTDFDPGPLFRAINPRQPPSVEGRFILTARVASQASQFAALPASAVGNCELTSKGGTFRGVPVNVGNLVENSGKLASWIASAGNAITSIAGRKDFDDITSRSQAANELAKMLAAISYDQLSVVFSRDDTFRTTVKEFTLISPEFRLTGRGHAAWVPGRPPLDDVVTMELQLRARGRAAELMKYLGVLEPKPDDLGYAACTIPIRIGGTLARLDATDFSNRLVALAVEKTGLTDKAVDWINRLRGKTPN